MLMLVRDTESAAQTRARFADQAATVAGLAAAPFRHVPAAFLAAVAGLFPQLLDTDDRSSAAL
ncbi:MAG: hypothetical protein NVS3B26_01400 [Mycobacteriales bacterium]